jgi:hypothetical protein
MEKPTFYSKLFHIYQYYTSPDDFALQYLSIGYSHPHHIT